MICPVNKVSAVKEDYYRFIHKHIIADETKMGSGILAAVKKPELGFQRQSAGYPGVYAALHVIYSGKAIIQHKPGSGSRAVARTAVNEVSLGFIKGRKRSFKGSVIIQIYRPRNMPLSILRRGTHI